MLTVLAEIGRHIVSQGKPQIVKKKELIHYIFQVFYPGMDNYTPCQVIPKIQR